MDFLTEKTFFNSLGFLTVLLSNVPEKQQAQRAAAIARLVEEFCANAAAEPARQETSVLRDALEALELCLEEDELTYSSEQAAERALARIKQWQAVQGQ